MVLSGKQARTFERILAFLSMKSTVLGALSPAARVSLHKCSDDEQRLFFVNNLRPEEIVSTVVTLADVAAALDSAMSGPTMEVVTSVEK
ncbi:hypothetical protein PTSG_12415 [Salpingoeca rosetta]|uniref:Uncharacterized protein n=1 Tax=Salpingoeca rosetta (strain ATCC 50818 / BSB-021) TaxID=946362 RepID=F2UCB4_SALR5|nr:uncharacterized protein PTSG_12415 [Salpingoeca rosetta]EGD74221.1 hypothetical protein PTSG_12415 [Salpingoeca rosetta]|eukprot:XP_004993121.1 hypothetical protein PTSG_12415 [Salpingoeca rosetta]